MEHLCRVCGAPLVVRLVRCPLCETPHHRDCWEYNRGCAIYGCQATAFAQESAAAAEELLLLPSEEPGWLEHLYDWAAGIFRSAPPPVEHSVDAGQADLALEKKEVARWIGTGSPAALMHAYGLFEQRHPRESLGTAQQAAAAHELLEAGFPALGLEAIDKALRRPGQKDRDSLLTHRADTLASEPAWLFEAIEARSECPGAPALDKLLAAVQDDTLAAADLQRGKVYLASLSVRGWEKQAQSALSHPYFADDALPEHGRLLSGPFDSNDARTRLRTRWASAQPSLLLPASALDLPPRFERVHRLHFSSREAVFETDRAERHVDWGEVRAIFYGLFHSSKSEWKRVQEIYQPGSRGGTRTHTTATLVQSDDFEPILELHLGDDPIRVRVDRPDSRLFEYLGRRRMLSHDRNIVLAAKDAVRFAPAARVSHGMLGLLMEHAGPGTRFTSLPEFDEYVLWFRAMGSQRELGHLARASPAVVSSQ